MNIILYKQQRLEAEKIMWKRERYLCRRNYKFSQECHIGDKETFTHLPKHISRFLPRIYDFCLWEKRCTSAEHRVLQNTRLKGTTTPIFSFFSSVPCCSLWMLLWKQGNQSVFFRLPHTGNFTYGFKGLLLLGCIKLLLFCLN